MRVQHKKWTNKLDKLFSLDTRSRGKCERCGKTTTLQTSHIYSRSYKELRWEKKNAFCLCAGCHFWWHKNPLEAVEFTKKKLGTKGCNWLKEKSRKSKQWFDEDYKKLEKKLCQKKVEQSVAF